MTSESSDIVEREPLPPEDNGCALQALKPLFNQLNFSISMVDIKNSIGLWKRWGFASMALALISFWVSWKLLHHRSIGAYIGEAFTLLTYVFIGLDNVTQTAQHVHRMKVEGNTLFNTLGDRLDEHRAIYDGLIMCDLKSIKMTLLEVEHELYWRNKLMPKLLGRIPGLFQVVPLAVSVFANPLTPIKNESVTHNYVISAVIVWAALWVLSTIDANKVNVLWLGRLLLKDAAQNTKAREMAPGHICHV